MLEVDTFSRDITDIISSEGPIPTLKGISVISIRICISVVKERRVVCCAQE